MFFFVTQTVLAEISDSSEVLLINFRASDPMFQIQLRKKR